MKRESFTEKNDESHCIHIQPEALWTVQENSLQLGEKCELEGKILASSGYRKYY